MKPKNFADALNQVKLPCIKAAVPAAASHKKKYIAVGVACAAVAAVAVAGYFLLKKKDITIKLCCDMSDRDGDGEDCCVCEDYDDQPKADEPKTDAPCQEGDCKEEPGEEAVPDAEPGSTEPDAECTSPEFVPQTMHEVNPQA
ncbi:MAG: hypothetical protein VB111_06090 [Clostridiaceae bacterium]|nr:hypothetical protein [Clostridiaceae bacterium]